MRLNTAIFNKLRPKNVRLAPWKSAEHPQPADNPMRSIIMFARYMGIKKIPAKTLEKLQTDPYFKYCFYYLRLNDIVYSPTAIAQRERLAGLIKTPDLADDADLARGLRYYLNNFVGYMPGGIYRRIIRQFPDADLATMAKRITDIVDHELKKRDHSSIMIPPPGASPAQEADYFKTCLDIWDTLIKEHGFDPEELWK